ncbi:MAG TPA: hypothetical protein VHA73_12585 [Acidimicrobiales bacterium]|nr:hypothetical protein [Acidimicrobiales bacterium]
MRPRPPVPAPWWRRLAVPVAVVVAIGGVAGCGADRHLQHQEAAVRARTCESLIERRFTRVPPVLPVAPWLPAASERPRLSGVGNQAEVVRRCKRLGDELVAREAVRRMSDQLPSAP